MRRTNRTRLVTPLPSPPLAATTAAPWKGPLALASLAVLAVILTLAPSALGPGITCDEPYHVAYGKRLVWALRHQGLTFFTPRQIAENFPWRPDGPPAHPPLGNWILGLTHHLFDPEPDNLAVVSVVPARFAPAIAFGLLIFLVGWATGRREGSLAGTVAAAAVMLVPRVFGHAHLAALDMLTALTFVAAALAITEALSRPSRGFLFAGAGAIWGFALLTRLHAVLLLPPVVCWLFWRLRRRAWVPLAWWLGSGALVFFVGWPWLWIAPAAHLRQFFATATDRAAIHVFYAGQVWADTQVPRHFAPVTFLTTLPLGLLGLGLVGIWAKRRDATDPAFWLLMGSLVFVLAVFCLPGTPVYDGERLFLMAFPLWATAVGVGAKRLHEVAPLRAWPVPTRTAAISLFVALQGTGLVLYHPYQLSHYSLLVGGLPGAARLGFEVTYWGDSINESLLEQAALRANKTPIVYAPNLAPFQAPMVGASSPSITRSGSQLVAWGQVPANALRDGRYGVLYHRRADMAGVPEPLRSAQSLVEIQRQGIWLARLVELSPQSVRGEAKESAGSPPAK